jgi:predicted amidohydrolase
MSRSEVRVTIGQIRATEDRGANLMTALQVIAEGAQRDADLVVLPEYASAFNPRGTGADHAEALDGPYLNGLREATRRAGLTVIAGVLVPGKEPGRAQNLVVAVGPDGELLGSYAKVHLYDAFGQRESDRLDAGAPDVPPLVVAVGALRVGVLTCYDLRFPESARRLVDAGADVLAVPAAWASGPLKADHWRTLARARAIENIAMVLAVGQAGPGVTGRSVVVGPDGQVVLELGVDPEIGTADIDPAALAAARRANPSVDNRRYAVVPR